MADLARIPSVLKSPEPSTLAQTGRELLNEPFQRIKHHLVTIANCSDRASRQSAAENFSRAGGIQTMDSLLITSTQATAANRRDILCCAVLAHFKLGKDHLRGEAHHQIDRLIKNLKRSFNLEDAQAERTENQIDPKKREVGLRTLLDLTGFGKRFLQPT